MLAGPLGPANRDQVDHFVLLNYSSKKLKGLFLKSKNEALKVSNKYWIMWNLVQKSFKA